MTKENIYDLIKAHATELVDGRFRFKKVDLKEACAELEDCFKRLHKPVVMQAEGSEETRRKFCLWYYAQSQPLDANKVFEWFRAEGAAVGYDETKWKTIDIQFDEWFGAEANQEAVGQEQEMFAEMACEVLEGIKFKSASDEIEAVNQVAAALRHAYTINLRP